MLHAISRAWKELRARGAERRRAKLRALVASAVFDCVDPTRQAERLARWNRVNSLLSH